MNFDGFTLHTRTKKKRKGRFMAEAERTPEEEVERLLGVLDVKKRAIEGEDGWWREWKGLLGQVDEQLGGVRGTERGENISTSQGSTTHQDPNDEKPRKRRKILCLGIGKISESNEAKMQYLLLRDMITVLDIAADDVELYDPLFTPADILLLKRHGYQILPNNELGAHQLDSSIPTLAYLPHCPRELYEAFLRANWDRTRWEDGRVVLVGNPLRDYVEKTSTDKAEQEIPCIAAISPQMTTLPLPDLASSHPASSAYNSTVIQYLSTSSAEIVDWSVKGAAVQAIKNPTGEVFTNEIGEDISVIVKANSLNAPTGQDDGLEGRLSKLDLAGKMTNNATVEQQNDRFTTDTL